MTIEVWKQQLFGGYRKVASNLHVSLSEGHVYASWKKTTIFSDKRIPVSDSLAAVILGARREPCPYVGTQPKYGRFKSGYACHDRTIGEDCNTIEHCSACGYFRFYSGNPRFRAFVTGEYGDDEGHPYLTYLTADRTYGTLTEADCTANGELTTVQSHDDSTLIFWVHSANQSENGLRKAWSRAFPDATVLFRGGKYTILSDPIRTPALQASY